MSELYNVPRRTGIYRYVPSSLLRTFSTWPLIRFSRDLSLERTGTDVKQTCIISASTLGTALRPSSTITPTSTSTSSASGTLSYPSEAITSTISIARPTAEGTTPSSEPPAPSETAQSENGSLKAADAWNAGGLIVLVAVTFYFL